MGKLRTKKQLLLLAGFTVARKAENGGDITFNAYQELETCFAEEKLHPADFKSAVEGYINRLLEPIRQEFTNPTLM